MSAARSRDALIDARRLERRAGLSRLAIGPGQLPPTAGDRQLKSARGNAPRLTAVRRRDRQRVRQRSPADCVVTTTPGAQTMPECPFGSTRTTDGAAFWFGS
jgi:hypothetical protein